MSLKAKSAAELLAALPDGRKAEIIDDELVLMSPTGDEPNYAAGEIFVSLRQQARATGVGRAVGDNAGCLVALPHRGSFSPDAPYYLGPSGGMNLFPRAPVFAVEVRSEGDYGPAAERDRAAKRADYVAAGTLVVWDVDLLGDAIVRVYRAGAPTAPTLYRRGELAEAKPALPGWRMPVDDLFLP